MKIRMTVLVVMTLLFGAIAIGCESSPKTTSYVKLLNFGETMGVSDDIFIGTIISITNEDDIKAKYEGGVLRLSVPKADMKQVENSSTIYIE